MKHDLEPQPIHLDEVQAEKLVKDQMKQTDPGKVDFSEDFLNQLHDKIMAQVEQTEIQAEPLRQKVPWRVRLWWTRSANKTKSILAVALVIVTAGAGSSSVFRSKVKDNSIQIAVTDAFIQEALKSPEVFENMIAGSLGQNDFLVDVAGGNFDHLNLNDFDHLFGASAQGLETR
jgi:hypothetical protein